MAAFLIFLSSVYGEIPFYLIPKGLSLPQVYLVMSLSSQTGNGSHFRASSTKKDPEGLEHVQSWE